MKNGAASVTGMFERGRGETAAGRERLNILKLLLQVETIVESCQDNEDNGEDVPDDNDNDGGSDIDEEEKERDDTPLIPEQEGEDRSGFASNTFPFDDFPF
ncbi:hypothetical protein RRG08_032624 [Elysia crispata]|uniref:Uncharacterized protein n=1 Tax=Elysia crispata TaxID=231223 RepID=A0AAE1CQ84_9GAST|nr:hypothetical protein RRG08_032624 [Elysia crispata]